MNAATYLLAQRYLWNSTKEHSLWTMIIISCLSIGIGSFSLTLVTAIMNGFEQAIHTKMKTVHPAATLYANYPIALDAIQHLVSKEFPEVTTLSPYSIGHVMIKPDASYHDEDTVLSNVAVLHSINPEQEQYVSMLEQKIVAGVALAQAIANGQIAIGKTMAENYGITIGDSVTLYYIANTGSGNNKIESATVTVGAFFQTGIDEYDTGIIYCSDALFNTLFPDSGYTQIGLAFAPGTAVESICNRLQQRTGFQVKSWQQLYPALVSALTLEKYAMFFILALISLVASMNIIALIFMLITYKKADIALLKALGMSTRHIQRFFITIGMTISSIAMFFGIAAAWISCLLLERYPFITLPDAYYVSHLPCTMTLTIAITVALLISIITYIACWSATRGIGSINIAHILRFEG